MTEDDVDGCLRLLEAYWPGEWTQDRYLVWAEAMRDLDGDTSRVALRELGRSARFPTVAEFLDRVRERTPADGAYFAPGSGYLEPWVPREIEGERPVVDFDAIRAQLHRDGS